MGKSCFRGDGLVSVYAWGVILERSSGGGEEQKRGGVWDH